MNNQWVKNALKKLYATPEYEKRIVDEFYKTQPIPQTYDNNQSILVYFGNQVKIDKPFREPLEPHFRAIIKYPDIDIYWSDVSKDEFIYDRESFKNLDYAEEIKKAQTLVSQRSMLINNYCESLSKLLETKSLINTSQYNIKKQPQLAREIDSLLNLITEPLLRWLYDQIAGELKMWIARNL